MFNRLFKSFISKDEFKVVKIHKVKVLFNADGITIDGGDLIIKENK